jgi:hypothetical protein
MPLVLPSPWHSFQARQTLGYREIPVR